MAQFPQTTDVTVEIAAGATPGPAAGRCALVAPAGGADTIGVEVVRVYSSLGPAITERGTGSKLADGVKHVLSEGHNSVVTIAPEEFTVNYTFGDASALSAGQVPANSVPLTSITSATKDSVAIPLTDIVYLWTDTLVTDYVFAGTEKMAINMATGKIKLSSATSGVGAGLVLAAKRHDWTTAFELLGEEDYEYIVPAGYTYEAKNWGVWNAILTHVNADHKMTAGMLPSGATPAASKDFVEAQRNGSLTLLAAKEYTGDGTSAYAGYRARFDTHAQIKLQPAPRSITITKGYTFSDYGEHVSPAEGTWHKMGVNAVYKYRGGYFVSSSRSSTGMTVKDRWDFIMRIVNEVRKGCQTIVNNQVAADPTGNTVDQTGLDITQVNLEGYLRSVEAKKKITGFSLRVPPASELTTEEVDNGQMPEIELSIRPARQGMFFPIKIKAT